MDSEAFGRLVIRLRVCASVDEQNDTAPKIPSETIFRRLKEQSRTRARFVSTRSSCEPSPNVLRCVLFPVFSSEGHALRLVCAHPILRDTSRVVLDDRDPWPCWHPAPQAPIPHMPHAEFSLQSAFCCRNQLCRSVKSSTSRYCCHNGGRTTASLGAELLQTTAQHDPRWNTHESCDAAEAQAPVTRLNGCYRSDANARRRDGYARLTAIDHRHGCLDGPGDAHACGMNTRARSKPIHLMFVWSIPDSLAACFKVRAYLCKTLSQQSHAPPESVLVLGERFLRESSDLIG